MHSCDQGVGSNPANCSSTLFATEFDLVENGIYYLKVVAENEAATGFKSQAPVVRQTYKLSPVINNYNPDHFLSFVAEFRGTTLIWEGSETSTVVGLTVRHLTFITLGEAFNVTVRKGDNTKATTVTVTGRSLAVEDGYSFASDPLGVNVDTALVMGYPAFGSGGGVVFVDIFNPQYPAKLVTVKAKYFEYPRPEFSRVSPRDGPLAGNNEIDIYITELKHGTMTEPGTRYGAGLVNFITATVSQMQVVFNNSRAASRVIKTIPPVTDGASEATVMLTVTVPPNAAQGYVPIGLKLDGALVALKNDEVILYKFRQAFIATVSPSDGLTTGKQTLELLIRDASVMTPTAVSVTMNGRSCNLLQLPEGRSGSYWVTDSVTGISREVQTVEMQIFLTTPEFTEDDAGSVSFVVTLSRGGMKDSVINSDPLDDLYTLQVPPGALLVDASIAVEGRLAGELWASRTTPTKIVLTINYFYPGPGSELEVTIGGAQATGVTP